MPADLFVLCCFSLVSLTARAHWEGSSWTRRGTGCGLGGEGRGEEGGGGCTLDWVGLGYSAGRAGGRAGGGGVAVGESSPGFRFLEGGEWGEAAEEMD